MFRLLAIYCFLGFQAGCISVAQPVVLSPSEPGDNSDLSRQDAPWQPATFRGLKIGEARREQLISMLGKPKVTYPAGSEVPAEQRRSGLVDEFDDSTGAIPGRVIATYSGNSNMIAVIEVYPKRLSVDEIKSIFGKMFRMSRYRIVTCPGDEGSSLITEAVDGELEFIEWRSLGIAAAVRQDAVISIEYVNKPIASSDGKCPQL